MKFEDMTTSDEVISYLKDILTRPGGKKTDTYLYHYTSISSIAKILKSKTLLLGNIHKMNDHLEEDFIEKLLPNSLSFACFSKYEENIAMYKMYAKDDNSTGASLGITFEDAKKLADGIKRLDLCEDFEPTGAYKDVNLYWTAIGYKNIHKDVITAGTVSNGNIKDPFSNVAFAGLLKYEGWEYEAEVRLTAVYKDELKENQRLAIPIPDSIVKNMIVIESPNFSSNSKSDADIRTIERIIGKKVQHSFYEHYADL